MTARTIAIFDLGGVLIDWNPRHLFRKLFDGDEGAMEHFLATICTQHWNERQDEGRTFAEAAAELIDRHPDQAELIEAYGRRFDEMMAGPIAGTVAILAELRDRAVPLYGLTNWSAETFPLAQLRFDFLCWFAGIVVSGHEKVIKPDPRIYRILLERYGVAAEDAVYIDDNPKNAIAASQLGIHGIHFTDPPALRRELTAIGLL
jgi:2-haloacid dehalogenase